MQNLIKDKRLLWLGFILSLILLLLANALSWIDNNFYLWLESKVDYKWMLTILLMLTLSIIFVCIYSLTFSTKNTKAIPRDIPEKICPKCGKPKLEVVSSTIRSFEYKCKNCGFEHRTLKEGQTNTLKK